MNKSSTSFKVAGIVMIILTAVMILSVIIVFVALSFAQQHIKNESIGGLYFDGEAWVKIEYIKFGFDIVRIVLGLFTAIFATLYLVASIRFLFYSRMTDDEIGMRSRSIVAWGIIMSIFAFPIGFIFLVPYFGIQNWNSGRQYHYHY